MIVAKNCDFWSVFPQISCGRYPPNSSKFPKPHFSPTCTYLRGRRSLGLRHNTALPDLRANPKRVWSTTFSELEWTREINCVIRTKHMDGLRRCWRNGISAQCSETAKHHLNPSSSEAKTGHSPGAEVARLEPLEEKKRAPVRSHKRRTAAAWQWIRNS